MAKISFNAQALGIARYSHCRDVRHSGSHSPLVPVMAEDTSVKALFEVLGFSNVEGFPPCGDRSAKDVDP